MDAEQLRRALFSTIAKRDWERFNALCFEKANCVAENFHLWRRIPQAVRSNPKAAREWAESIIVIAQFLGSVGYPDLLAALEGNDEDNPITRWRDVFLRAQQLTSDGAATESTELLLGILTEMERTTGSALMICVQRFTVHLGRTFFRRATLDGLRSLQNLP